MHGVWPVRRVIVGLAVLVLVVYNVNFRAVGSNDSMPARYLPLAMLHRGTLDLSALRGPVTAHGDVS